MTDEDKHLMEVAAKVNEVLDGEPMSDCISIIIALLVFALRRLYDKPEEREHEFQKIMEVVRMRMNNPNQNHLTKH